MKNILYLYKKILLISYFLLPTSYLSAQPNRDQYRDKVWIFGYEGFAHVQEYGNSLLTFNSDNTTDTSSFFGNMDFTAVSSSLCDTVGNLVCYTNGIYIADKTDNKMINGDSLDYGLYWESYRLGGSGGIQGGVCVLPMPNKKNSAVLLYHDVEAPNGRYIVKGLKTAFIDFDKNNRKGVVVQKDIPLFSDSMQAPLATTCRHANGRDWWIIAIKWGMGKYYKTLLRPNGLVAQVVEMMKWLIPPP